MTLLLTAAGLHAQALKELPQPPPSGLSDEGNILGRNSDAQRQIINQLKKLESEHNYRLYVILERSLIGTTPSTLAADLQQEWMPKGEGLVVVFESDTRRLGFGRGLDASEGIMEGTEGVPAYSLVEIISDALQASEGIEVPELFIQKLVDEMCVNLEAYFKKKEAPEKGGRSLRLALATIGALSLLALGGMMVGWMMGKSEKKQGRVLKFPEIDTPERLGAPYGGGGGGSSYFGR
ncbi:MAG: TPM domain-containing protein [Luteolibacter sp.]